jgi:hypothetical protein
MFRIQHPRGRRNDLQSPQDGSPSIDRFPARVAVIPRRNRQRSRRSPFRTLLGLQLRRAMQLVGFFALRKSAERRDHSGGFLVTVLLLLHRRLVLIGSRSADSN